MMANSDLVFVRQEIVEAQPAPGSNRGLVAWVRENLFATPGDSLMTVIGLLFIFWAVPHLYSFLFGNAVFPGEGVTGENCRIEGTGACWAFVWDRMTFFVYGFFPRDPRWADAGGFIGNLMAYYPAALARFALQGIQRSAVLRRVPGCRLHTAQRWRFRA